MVALLQIVRDWKSCLSISTTRKDVCVCVFGCVLHILPLGGSRRKVTHCASPAYKWSLLPAGATAWQFSKFLLSETWSSSQGHNSPAAQIFNKAASDWFVTYHPIQHGNSMGTLRCREDQPRLQCGHEDSPSQGSSGAPDKTSSELYHCVEYLPLF